MAQRIFTKWFFASLIGSLIGAIIATMPLFWSAMKLDLRPLDGSGQLEVPIYFGLAKYDYASLVQLMGETLFAGIALGVSGAITWYESFLDGRPLGKLSAFFAGASVVGSLLAIMIFIGVSEAKINPRQINGDFVKYIQASYLISAGLFIFYFSCILQVRRVKDLGVFADG